MALESNYALRSANHQHECADNVFDGLTASATVTAGQVLIVSGSGTVAPGSGASAAMVGVALGGAASSAPVRVITRGPVFSSTATGAITAGAQIIAATAGTVATVGGATAFQVLGVALDSVSGGAAVRWVMT